MEPVDRWLSQFTEPDRLWATELYGSLKFVSESDFETSLRLQIDAITDGPLALFAVRGLHYEKRTRTHYLGAYNNKKYKPLAVPPGEVGSEGRVGHIVAKVASGMPGRCLDHPSIDEMRRARCKTIVLVDDLIASGKRVSEFARHMYRHPTITSWYSYHRIAFVAIAYAATIAGQTAVKKLEKPHLEVAIRYGCPTLHDENSVRYRAMRRICADNAGRTSRSGIPLGYGNTGAMTVFAHGCPNNAPAILWADNLMKWRALFPNRMVPTEMLASFGATNQRTVDNSVSKPWWRRDSALLSAFLREASRHKQWKMPRVLRLSILTGMPTEECALLLKLCVTNGLLSESYSLTPAGLHELAVLRKSVLLDRSTAASPTQELEPYFPRTYRPRLYLAENPARPGSDPDCG
jgi:hypothetical protein